VSPRRATPKPSAKSVGERAQGYGTLSPATPIAELHCHLGGSVTPAIMWGIAHAQGIRLPSKDYWAFRKMITAGSKRTRSFNGYLDLFHWTELIQSSPIAVERSVYEVVAGAYRKNHITTMELRFNPMKRNRNGEQDLDHIIAAAIRGADRAALEYPVKPGIILILDREFTLRQNEIIVEKAIAWASRGIVGIDIAGRESPNFKVAEYKRMFQAARKAGLGITVHTGESGPVSEMLEVVKQLEPDRIGHGVKAVQDAKTLKALAERKIVLEICPTSNLMTRVVADWEEFRAIFARLREGKVRYAIGTDGPEMLQTYIRDELAALGRHGILSVAEQEAAAATSIKASFVKGAAAVAIPRSDVASVRVSREES
jgi:adenosine deaminase